MIKKLVYYEKLGFGPNEKRTPVVLLRGLGRTVEHWQGFDQQLSKHIPVITIENRGMGLSPENLPWNWSMSDMAQDVLEVCDELQVGKAHILGVSLGGMIAMEFGVLFPDRVHSLCVINSSIGGVQRRLTLAGTQVFAKTTIDPKNAERHLSRVLISPKNSKKVIEEHIKIWNNIREKHGNNIANTVKQLAAVLRFTSTKRLHKIKSPTLVVCGSDDLLVPNSGSLLIHQNIKGSQFMKIADAGHELMLDKPEELIKLLMDFTKDL